MKDFSAQLEWTFYVILALFPLKVKMKHACEFKHTQLHFDVSKRVCSCFVRSLQEFITIKTIHKIPSLFLLILLLLLLLLLLFVVVVVVVCRSCSCCLFCGCVFNTSIGKSLPQSNFPFLGTSILCVLIHD